MGHLMMAQFVAFLGLRKLYWAIIIVVILAIVGVFYFASGRNR